MTVATPVPLVFGDYALEDRYRLDKGRVYMTGIQALVRLPMMQRQRDLAAGLNTGGFISGYRGSPLGSTTARCGRPERYLKDNNIHFQPGINEDLAATAVWGTQQVNLFPGAKVDGVFAHLVRQGSRRRPLDGRAQARQRRRHVAARRRASRWRATTTAAKSSTLPHQSEQVFVGRDDPGAQSGERAGISSTSACSASRMSRYSGCWIGFKAIPRRSSRRLGVGRSRPRRDRRCRPTSQLPPGGLGIRWPDPPLEAGEAPAWTEDGGGRRSCAPTASTAS